MFDLHISTDKGIASKAIFYSSSSEGEEIKIHTSKNGINRLKIFFLSLQVFVRTKEIITFLS